MEALLAVTLVALLTGCGSGLVVDEVPPAEPSYTGRLDLQMEHRDEATVAERGGSAVKALECGGAPYDAGGSSYDSGEESSQGSPRAAARNFLEHRAYWTLPEARYRVDRVDDDGWALVTHEVDDEVKVALVLRDDVEDWQDDTGWGVHAWAVCDPAEVPAVARQMGIDLWSDAEGRPVAASEVYSEPGPEHCDWQSVTFLHVGSGDPRYSDGEGTTYVGNPRDLADHVVGEYDASATLPADAKDTGVRRDGRQLHLGADGDTAYLVSVEDASDVEAWPRLKPGVACG